MSDHDWLQTHYRRQLVDEYLEHEGTLMTPAMHAEFPQESDLVRALHQRWVTIVEGCLDIELETGEGSPMDALRAAYGTATRHAPALRRTLDRLAENPVLHELTEREYIRLARATGALRPGHTVNEGIEAVHAEVAAIVVEAAHPASRVQRWVREREVRRLVTASMRGY